MRLFDQDMPETQQHQKCELVTEFEYRMENKITNSIKNVFRNKYFRSNFSNIRIHVKSRQIKIPVFRSSFYLFIYYDVERWSLSVI